MPNFFTKLFKRKSKSVVGIDIGSSAIKVVQLKERLGKPFLENYGVISLAPFIGRDIGNSANLSSEKLGSALKEIFQNAKITATRNGFAIPFGSSLVSVIQVPDVKNANFETMIPIEARKYIPVPISEVTINWIRVSPEEEQGENKKKKGEKKKEDDGKDSSQKEEEGSSKKEGPPTADVLIAAIHNNTINKYQSVAKQAGIKPGFFEIETFSAIRSVVDENNQGQPVMIMDVGASSTKLYVVDRGLVMKSHTINRGSENMTEVMSQVLGVPFAEAEKKKRTEGVLGSQKVSEAVSSSFDFLFLETRKILENYYGSYNKKVEKVFLVGGGGVTEGFASMISANLEIPVIYGDPFSKIGIPDELKEVVKYNGPEFAVAAGVALRGLEE